MDGMSQEKDVVGMSLGSFVSVPFLLLSLCEDQDLRRRRNRSLGREEKRNKKEVREKEKE